MKNLKTLINDINNIWDEKQFQIIREPILIKTINDINKMESLPRVLDMPIKMNNSDEIILPSEFQKNDKIKEIISEILKYEKDINKNWEDYYIYLTYDKKMIEPHNTHRREGWHIDGLQSINYPNKMKVCHSYLLSDCLETEFAIQSFDVSKLEYDKHNWFNELGKQVKSKNIKTYGHNKLVCMTAYQVHRCNKTEEEKFRNFIRIEFSLKEFNRIGNTINENLKTNWNYIRRDIPTNLK